MHYTEKPRACPRANLVCKNDYILNRKTNDSAQNQRCRRKTGKKPSDRLIHLCTVRTNEKYLPMIICFVIMIVQKITLVFNIDSFF